jgi:hypothetical protein
MQKIGILIVGLSLLVAACSESAEGKPRAFYDGLFELTIPAGWKVEQNPTEKSLTLRPNPNDEATALIIFPPNPRVIASGKDMIGTYVASFSIAAGHGDNLDVLERGREKVAGYTAESQAFGIPKRHANVVGTGYAVNVGGFVTLMFAMTTPDLYDAVMPQAKEVLDSYTVDAMVLAKRKDELLEVALYSGNSLDEKVVFDALRLSTQDKLKSRPIPWHTIRAFFK